MISIDKAFSNSLNSHTPLLHCAWIFVLFVTSAKLSSLVLSYFRIVDFNLSYHLYILSALQVKSSYSKSQAKHFFNFFIVAMFSDIQTSRENKHFKFLRYFFYWFECLIVAALGPDQGYNLRTFPYL